MMYGPHDKQKRLKKRPNECGVNARRAGVVNREEEPKGVSQISSIL